MKKGLLILFCFLLVLNSYSKESLKEYKTKNIIIVVIDGVRYSESWGDSSHQYTPCFSNEIANFGVVNTEFYNNGVTRTTPGFMAITTGVYQEINNLGKALSKYPSIFQYLIKKESIFKENAWIINSKNKLAVLGNCKNVNWKDKYLPSLDCGMAGVNSATIAYAFGMAGISSSAIFRDDRLTLTRFFNIMSEHRPKLTLLGFVEPDLSGHRGSWDDYLAGIKNTDEYIDEVFRYINNDPYYSGTTTLFITTDHGRHLDGDGGFYHHGCGCDGCRHLIFFAYGPDFKKGVINIRRELIDIPATIAEIFQFDAEYIEGEIMYELFK